MKLLVVGHSLIIDSNRKFWSVFAGINQAHVDTLAPETWSSNLSRNLRYEENQTTDQNLKKAHRIKTFFRGQGSFFFFSPLKTWKILQATDYDVIFLNQETWALSTLMFLLVKFMSRNAKTKIYLCVAQNLKKNKLKFLHPYERWIARNVHTFLYCSEEVKEVLRWKGIPTRCAYLPLPYDDSVYIAAPKEEGERVLKLGYLGRISRDKGMQILSAACEELERSKTPFQLILGGKGEALSLFERKPYVQYLGLIPHAQAHLFYQKIDIFILPSRTMSNWKEQFGRVIVEAFGAGKPVIGSDSGSIPEVLQKLSWDYVYREDSSEDLVRKIQALSEKLKTATGQLELEKSIELNRRQFSQSEVSKTLFKLFQE